MALKPTTVCATCTYAARVGDKYTVNHKKGTLFISGITWPNVDQTSDTTNTSYDTYVGIVNLNGFVQPVRFYH